MREEVGDSDEDDEDDQMEEEVDIQQAATSTAESNHYVVKVTKTAHKFSKDDFIFKDMKGRSRSTTRDD